MNPLLPYLALAGRLLIALIFVLSALGKLADLHATQLYMQSVGISAPLVYPTVVLELLAGGALMLGWRVKPFALALAAFCVATAVLFHSRLTDQVQLVMFLKNLAITGGMLLLAYYGAGPYSLDRWIAHTAGAKTGTETA